MDDIRKEINEKIGEENFNGQNKRYALMLFETEVNLGISNTPNKWVNYANRFFTNGLQALEAYSNIPCPASQLVDGRTPEELEKAMTEMLVHFSDDKWLEENLYPCL